MEAVESRELLIRGLAALGVSATPTAAEAVLRHLDLVRTWNERMNLTAITEEREMIVKHALDSAAGLTVVKLGPGQRVLDVGTGAGFPGVVWKCLVPEIDLVLLESLQKRCRFLEEVGEEVVRLLGGAGSYRVVWGRAEDQGRVPEHRERYDVVTARAVAELRVLAEYCLPFVRVGGVFLAMKGPGLSAELGAAQNAVARLGGEVAEVRELELPEGGLRRSLVLIRKAAPTPKPYPRKAGVPAKNPL
ncbi:16S rRNA (guanine527-N7)-methyltransferase [Symbiobacterium terraclitae]|uniref:Ribosomal RNA small subunit methyltransferase G n=1 Tax=Symbiobacterium terraclitae TaxID=557451 RepID=A0ABS4JVE2_9FIRM|nr:16S rRNA (guanine(527)-N(7))-methyltransferase RsmG [Symbiobacterium terraclitae]MBP2019496.1 16S rRNA (guanine527-N7)-methyltransferase [Symbiobacterium terraclitae]